MASSTTPQLKIEGLSKTFPGQRALDQVEIAFQHAEVHALLGQNGSGKSTLIKVLTGFHQPDAGVKVWVDGREGHFTRTGPAPLDGEPVTVRAVHQHLGLVSKLSIVDNVALVTGYRRGKGGRVNWRAQAELTRHLLGRVGLRDLDVHTAVDQITPLQRTQVAIARSLHGWAEGSAGLLILDEPTAALPAEQTHELFELVRHLRRNGVAIIYVSHRLDDLVEIADHVTVLRDGRSVATTSMTGLGHDDLVTLMLGKAQKLAPASSAAKGALTTQSQGLAAGAGLRVRGLTGTQVTALDFDVAPGEIVGFTGLLGAGQGELPYLLVGARRPREGTLTIDGEDHDACRMTPRRAKQLGLALVPADRAAEAIVPQADVAQNIALPRLGAFFARGWLRPSRERAEAQAWIEKLSVAPRRHDKLVTELSGGNAQKVVLARWLAVARSGLVLAEPTAGVDIGAKALIYEHLREAAAAGLPVIVSSTDDMDLAQLCTRVIVLADGVVKAELVGEDVNEDSINHAVLSASEAHA